MTRPWRTLALLYPSVATPQVTRTMDPGERARNLQALQRVPGSVEAWSEGNAVMEPFEVVECERPLASLTDAGGGRWWAAPEDCAPELEGAGGRYDSVLVVWPGSAGLRVCGWGCTVPGFSSCLSVDLAGHNRDLYPEEGFVHEWLHQVEAVFRGLGVGADLLPDLHDAGGSTSCRPPGEPPFGRTYGEHAAATGSWQPWYRDWMTGAVRRPDGEGCFGLAPELWRRW